MTLKSWSCHSDWRSYWPWYSYGRKIWITCYWHGRRIWIWRCWSYWIWQSRLDTIQDFFHVCGDHHFFIVLGSFLENRVVSRFQKMCDNDIIIDQIITLRFLLNKYSYLLRSLNFFPYYYYFLIPPYPTFDLLHK